MSVARQRAIGPAVGLRGMVCLIAGVLAVGQAAETAPVRAGVSRVDLTPPLSMKAALGGYGARLSRPAEGVHDGVWAKALVLEQGGRRVALVTADVLAFPPGFEAAVVKALSPAEWTAGNLLLLPSHTHTSFDMMALHPGNTFAIPQVGVFHPELFEFTAARLAEAVRQAARDVVPVRLGTGSAAVEGRNRNRREGGGPHDPALTVTRVDTLTGSPLAVLVNWTAHPTFMEESDMLFSGDWPGHLQRTVEALVGQGVVTLFYNGAEGDQSATPPEGVSSRWERAERYGRELGIEAWRVWSGLRPVAPSTLGWRVETVALPPRQWHPDFMKTGGAEYGLDETMMRGFVDRLVPAQTQVTALRLGDLLLVGVPGELAASLGLEVKQRLRQETGVSCVVIGGLADEWVSYILPAEEYAKGGYEASMGYYGPDLARTLVEGLVHCGKAVGSGESAGSGGEPSSAQDQARPLRVAYFVTRDRQPCRDREARLDRVMREVQRFYRDGMQAAGYGERTFGLETDEAGRLRLHEVRAREDSAAYGRDGADKVRGEVEQALRAEGIEMSRETVVIFQTLLRWEGARAVEVGPFVGGGDHRAGTAWVYDDDRLDPLLLGSREAGGYYMRPCSVGEFNSHYIGGVAHELGHALGLPHVSETPDQASRGHALMGGGNHTYGEEQRGEGKGSFLHPVSAMRLARQARFVGEPPQPERTPDCRLRDLRARVQDGRMMVGGSWSSDIGVLGVVAYDDWGQVRDDYDAYGWLGRTEDGGRFSVELGVLRSGASQLRLTVVHVNGSCSTFAIEYAVGPGGVVDTTVFPAFARLAELPVLFARQDRAGLAARVHELEADGPSSADLLARARHLLELLDPAPPRKLADIPPEQRAVAVSSLRFAEEKVGWGSPLRDRVLAEGARPIWLQVGGGFHARGLFAHAPARHLLELTSGWNRFHARFGLQDGADGSVLFVVRGDGRELFRSELVRDHREREVSVEVAGVKRLELVVEDAGDGAAQDWGVWLEPELQR